LSEKLSQNQAYLGIGPGGTQRGVIRSGKFKVRSRKAEDGSLIQPKDDACKSIKKMLRKSGFGTNSIKEALRILDKSPENERVQIAPGLEVINWNIDKLEMDFKDSPLINFLVPLKIAFEFLACHLGPTVYDDVPQLCNLRQALRESIEDHECFRVERLSAKKYNPFHGIFFEGNNPYARVIIRLFGWLAFRVHFLELAVGGPRYIYTHYLDSNQEDIREFEFEENKP